ncbi:hexosaminidase D-like [Trichoplusia ni]|uniref:beta-N-acetylhexosaminidase n=1 Tax=Trichoplusia ni TaxID=7111 RepID=A0A7E5VLH9_TRINI|nr:hexosaminidase D-like [Trichoplusia ni]
MHRIVHLDLKGAPLKIPYLEKVLLAAKSWGATGVLLEWEDTFPYSSNLAAIGSLSNSGGDGLYSMAEVQHILQFAKTHQLEAIQLIQTIGHMEFVLKHPVYRGLREIDRSPAVMCPSKPQSQVLVRDMIMQALEVQPDATYFHIGADEVWHTAVCDDCQARAVSHKHKAASLYLEHIRDLTLFIKEKRPDLIVLMWDDMLRSINVDTLREYELGRLVQPVLWHYNSSECFNIDPNLWLTYSQVFPQVWAASAFKGANGSCQVLSPVRRYVSNHEAWIAEIKKYSSTINFAGIILTGWSRYDHYATLCELLPVSLPSLASCLRTLTKSEDTPQESVVTEVLPSEEWPGEELARCIHSFVILKERSLALCNSDLVTTWLNPWQIEREYTVPIHVEGIAVAGQHMLSELSVLEASISRSLLECTGPRSSAEWRDTQLRAARAALAPLCEAAARRAQREPSVTPTA